MKKLSVGFSLVELMVVVSVVGIFSAVIYANFNDGSAQARDTERRGDLQILQSAIELYKNENGRYPAGCNAPGVWSGQDGSGYDCGPGGPYIVGLAPKYIPTLPTDPKLNSSVVNSGYMYATNAEGTVYKLMAKNTIESEDNYITDKNQLFESCDVTNNSTGICDSSRGGNVNSVNNWCTPSNLQFKTSYAVWGGYAEENPAYLPCPHVRCEEQTEKILCDLQ